MNAALERYAVELEWEHRRRRVKAVPTVSPSFGEWMARARPEYRWDYAHFVAMQMTLDRITAGLDRRAYFQVPIRHGKTEHNTIGYASYRLEANPSTRVLVCSYNDRRAQKFSRDIRRLTRSRGKVELSAERCFPFARGIALG